MTHPLPPSLADSLSEIERYVRYTRKEIWVLKKLTELVTLDMTYLPNLLESVRGHVRDHEREFGPVNDEEG